MQNNQMNKVMENDYLDNIIDKKMSRNQKTFWYIAGSAPDNKNRMRTFLLGPYSDSSQADSIASSKRLTSYQIVEIPTCDLGKASQIMKARRLKGVSSMGDIFERVRHKDVGGKDI